MAGRKYQSGKKKKKMNIFKLRFISLFLAILVLSIPLAFAYTLSYDQNGNLIQDKNYYYEYNSLNQLVKVREDNSGGKIIAEYFYDQGGNRIQKIEHKDSGDETTYYIDSNFIRVVNSSGTFDFTYYWHEGQLVGKKDSSGKKFYHPDHLGSTTLVTDNSGNVAEKTEYLPFGAVLEGGDERFLFTGQEADGETGLMYYGARYYSPNLRQFTQPDTIIQNVYDPQSLNRYAYVRNNPLKYVDPSGHTGLLCLAILGVTMAFSFLVQNVIVPALTLDQAITVGMGYTNVEEYGMAKGIGITALELTGGELMGAVISKGLGQVFKYGQRMLSGTSDDMLRSGKQMLASRTGSLKGGNGAVFKNIAKREGVIQEVPIRKLWARHFLDKKKKVMDTRIYEKGLDDIAEHATIWKFKDKLVIKDGTRRAARSSLIYGKQTVTAEVVDKSMYSYSDLPFEEQEVYDQAIHKMQVIIEDLRTR